MLVDACAHTALTQVNVVGRSDWSLTAKIIRCPVRERDREDMKTCHAIDVNGRMLPRGNRVACIVRVCRDARTYK